MGENKAERMLAQLLVLGEHHYRGVWERHVRLRLGGYRLRDLTPVVVDEFRSDLRLSGVGEATVAKALTLLSSMYRCAVTWDRVDANPLREIRIPQAKRKRLVRPVPPSKVEAMRVALLAAGRRRDAVLVATLAYAGLRPQEARALRWSDVGERTIRVERAAAGATIKATKTEELRTVRLLTPLAEDLASWRGESDDDGLVFPAADGSLMSDDAGGTGATACSVRSPARSGSGGRPYDLRHSFASLQIRQGTSVVDVARQMGNAPSVALDTYAHLFDERDDAMSVDPAAVIERARTAVDVRAVYAEAESLGRVPLAELARTLEALLRTRTADPLLTMEAGAFVGGCENSRVPPCSCGSMRLPGHLPHVPRATPSDPEEPGTCPQDLSPSCCLLGGSRSL